MEKATIGELQNAPAGRMNRADAFMVGMTAFVAANCISYFVLSGLPYVWGWGSRRDGYYFERLGFPFVSYFISFGTIVPGFTWSWIALTGNAVVALLVSYVISVRVASRLPQLWAEQSRRIRHPAYAVLAVIVVSCILFWLATLSRYMGLLVRNCVCLAGPEFMYAWLHFRRQLGWVRLLAVGVALFLLTLAIDVKYQDWPFTLPEFASAILPLSIPDGDGLGGSLTCVAIVRAIVPIFGILSVSVLFQVAHSIALPWVQRGGLSRLWRRVRETNYDPPESDN